MDFKSTLNDLFGNSAISERQIDEAINIVLEDTNSLTPEEQLEGMINLLIESGDSTLSPTATTTNQNEEEGAVGFSENNRNIQFNQNFERLLDIYPDISPDYLIEFCRKYEGFDFGTVVEDLARTDYVKVDKDPIDLWELLKSMLPNADPIYLRNQARVLVKRPPEELQQFLEEATEKNNYPTMQEYLIQKERSADLAAYIINFSANEYLSRVPNPVEKFLDPKHKSALLENKNEEDVEFALDVLNNHFIFQRKREIKKILSFYNNDLVKTWNKLKILPKAYRHPRKPTELKKCNNIPLLQEISFFKHEKLIKQFIKQKSEKYRNALEQARKDNLLQTCGCCFDDELIPEECYSCNKGCTFCKDCVKAGAEQVIGREETRFPCLAVCDSEFHYITLKMVLDKKTFELVCKRKQMEDIKEANIDGLETCPFCDFCMIPDEGDKTFKCGNIDCMKESCRKCRHISHIPLRCEEIEYDEDVKMRVYIENKMTEALLRTCWKCGKKFYKESGCNKMTCQCSALMCYVCGQPVKDYTHFGSQGTCPLYTENIQEFHLNRVREGAEKAKAELGINQNPTLLKFDPTRGIENDVH